MRQHHPTDPETPHTRLPHPFLHTRLGRIIEIGVVFLPSAAVLTLMLLRPDPTANALPWQIGASTAILGSLVLIWLGLRIRGQGWEHLGLRFGVPSTRAVIRTVLQALAALIAALAAFVAAAIVMANILGVPEGGAAGGFEYLQGSLPLLLMTLAAVYVTASFGEEVIYRGFLITRIRELLGTDTPHATPPPPPTGLAALKDPRSLVAILISAAAFGLAHFTWGIFGIVETAGMGAALGVAYVLFGRNLWVTILAHGVMDTALILPMYFTQPPTP